METDREQLPAARSLASLPSMLRSGPLVVTAPRPPAPVPSLPSALSPVPVCALAVSRMSHPPRPTRPEGRVVAVVAVSEHVRDPFGAGGGFMAWLVVFMTGSKITRGTATTAWSPC
jgi:hypothetical protein